MQKNIPKLERGTYIKLLIISALLRERNILGNLFLRVALVKDFDSHKMSMQN